MVIYCVECGAKVELNFKFCPICGSEINLSSSDLSSGNKTSQMGEVIICSNCGDENSLDSSVCHSCGIKLHRSKTSSVAVTEQKKIDSKPNNVISKPKKHLKQQSKNSVEFSTPKAKELESKKILVLVGVIAGVILLILIASGIIDLSGSKPDTTLVNQQNQSSGIDLSSITKINELKSVVEKDPSNSTALLDLANLRFDSGFFEDAAKNYEQYLKFDPKNADARIDMGVCYYNMQQFDKAESEVLAALKYSPKHQTGYLNLGVINLAKQNVEKAREWFNKAVEIDPNSDIGKKAKSLLQTH